MSNTWNRGLVSVLRRGNAVFIGSNNFGAGSKQILQQQSMVASAICGDRDDYHGTRNFSTRRMVNRSTRRRHVQRRIVGPTIDIANAMPLSTAEMDNASLVTLASLGKSEARKEILIRHIMTVDKISYAEACETFHKVAEQNRQGMWLLSLPYKLGIGIALTAAYVSIPMVFELNTVTWFNEHYVTADVPEPKDLETWLEVGSWSWNWMEPVLGQISFLLLCLQYSRAQITNMGIRPYTKKVMQMRADKLAKAFPQYNKNVVTDFSKSVTFYHDEHGL